MTFKFHDSGKNSIYVITLITHTNYSNLIRDQFILPLPLLTPKSLKVRFSLVGMLAIKSEDAL